MDLQLKNKLVVVSGSTEGIGYECAKQFVMHGARVVVNGRSQAKVDASVALLAALKPIVAPSESKQGAIIGIAADLSDAESTKQFIEKINALGTVDILVNNVGIFETKNFFEITDDDWLRYHNLNVMSTVRLSRAFLKPMIERGHGRVITISSEAGLKIIKEMIQYSVSKTAQIGITRGMAELTKGTNVTVNAVLPGPTWTPGVEEYVKGLAAMKGMTVEAATEEYFKHQEPTSLIQRFITPKEVADTVLFLASPLASATNGAAVRVEGGILRQFA